MRKDQGSSGERSLFKSACEKCSKAKIKCSEHCEKKGVQCIYAFKTKRGRKTVNKKGNEIMEKKVKPNLMSTYEKRVWSVFFTFFKNLKENAKDNHYAWNWFVVQLCRLESYVHQSQKGNVFPWFSFHILHVLEKDIYMKEVLDSFYKSMNLTYERVRDAAQSPCSISSQMCVVCSSTALDHGSVRYDQPKEEKPTLLALSSSINQGKLLLNGKKQHWDAWKATKFDIYYENNTHACLVYETCEGSFGVVVNEKFKAAFGYDDNGIMELLTSTGGGFLPWGGDILAAILVNEADLLIYLKVMATKYQVVQNAFENTDEWKRLLNGGLNESQSTYSNLPENQYGKNIVPSLNAFPCWMNSLYVKMNSCTNLQCVIDRLESTMCQFSTMIRTKRHKHDPHKIYLRFEFMCLEPTIGNYPVPKKTKKQVAATIMTHSEPFVNISLDDDRVMSSTNRVLWPIPNYKPPEYIGDKISSPTEIRSTHSSDKNLASSVLTDFKSEDITAVGSDCDVVERGSQVDNFDALTDWDMNFVDAVFDELNENDVVAKRKQQEAQVSKNGERTHTDTYGRSIDHNNLNDSNSLNIDVDQAWLRDLTTWAEN